MDAPSPSLTLPAPAAGPGAPAASRTQSAVRKRELLRHYKDNPPGAGVFAIRCAASGHVYVNASMNLQGALNRARFQLRMQGHRDRQLQQQWQQHGEAAFTFEVVDVLKRREDATEAQLREDLAGLLALWREELGA